MTREELLEMREYDIAKESTKYWDKNQNNDEVSIMTAFEDGAEWSDRHPDWRLVLKVFNLFDKHGLIKDDLCFDPEHFIRTVIMKQLKH